MRKSRYSDSQIMAILKQNENGLSVPDCHLACKTGPLLTKIAWKIDPPILLNFGFQLPGD